ncbi:MAG: hypothetical protein AB1416_08915, partial [Actinomycetota bacterium]
MDERSPTAVTSAPPPPAAEDVAHVPRHPRVMRVPAVAPLAPMVGWLAAWGIAAVAAACLREADVALGLGLGIADSAAVEDGVRPGLWLLVIQAGAFLIGGYAAARMARGNGMTHATLAWVVAMLATGADAVTGAIRDTAGVLARLDIPYWARTGLGTEWDTAVALGAFAVAALIGALLGG